MKIKLFDLDIPQTTAATTKAYEVGTAQPGSLILQVDTGGSPDSTYHLEGSIDGTTWFNITKSLYDLVNGAYLSTTFTSGLFALAPATGTPAGAPKFVRLNCIAQNTTPAKAAHASILDTHSF